MKNSGRKFLLSYLITAAALLIASSFYGAFQPYFLLGFVDGLFSFSGILLVLSGFRYLNNLGAYRIYALILYKFKRLFSVSSLSKREAYIEEKTMESFTEEGKAPPQQKNDENKKEKSYEDFAYQPVTKDDAVSSMFYSGLTLFLISIILGFLL